MWNGYGLVFCVAFLRRMVANVCQNWKEDWMEWLHYGVFGIALRGKAGCFRGFANGDGDSFG